MSLLLLLALISWAAAPVQADDDIPQPATLVNAYNGGYKDDYPQELARVQAYVLSAQSDIATQLGLRYGQGFIHPVSVRFQDGVPAINENPFFSVRTHVTGESFSQDLLVNVEAFAKHRDELSRKEDDLRSGFRYALAQVMLNDLPAADPGNTLPLWVSEGLAVYVSGDGGRLVQEVAGRIHRSRAPELVAELNNPGPFLTPRAWANYYLAIKYIFAQGGVGALQAFVRNLTDGNSAPDAIRQSLNQEWPVFVSGLHEYAQKTFEQYAPSEEEADRATPKRSSP